MDDQKGGISLRFLKQWDIKADQTLSQNCANTLRLWHLHHGNGEQVEGYLKADVDAYVQALTAKKEEEITTQRVALERETELRREAEQHNRHIEKQLDRIPYADEYDSMETELAALRVEHACLKEERDVLRPGAMNYNKVRLRAEAAEARADAAIQALTSIANNSCCGPCLEAGKFALSALQALTTQHQEEVTRLQVQLDGWNYDLSALRVEFGKLREENDSLREDLALAVQLKDTHDEW